jgi:hypothetical protein
MENEINMSDINQELAIDNNTEVKPGLENSKLKLATQPQKLLLILIHLILSACAILLSFYFIKKFNDASFSEISIPWEMPTAVKLKDGPPSFYYDPIEHRLVYWGSLDVETQTKLKDLLEFNTDHSSENQKSSTSNDEINTVIHTYQAAIARLGSVAVEKQAGQIQLLLLLGVMGGILGAVLRSLVDFVGHACYTERLDLSRWWPLYTTRPLIGAILGFLLVVLIKARLLTSLDLQQNQESFWWLGVAVLGGFSTVDVTQRLRLAAKAIFGTGKKEK